MADPRWRQIAVDLRLKIESGEIGRGGQPLPTEQELQDRYNASRNTVREAIKWLASRNLVYTRSGQGTFVRPKIVPFVTSLSYGASLNSEGAGYLDAVAASLKTPTESVPKVEIQPATELVASELKIPAGGMVVSRHQRRFIDDGPSSLQTTFYPIRLVEAGAPKLITAENMDEGGVKYLSDKLGIEQAGFLDRVKVRPPDADETGFFGLPENGSVAIIELTRTGYDADGQPYRVTVTTYPADRNQFVIVTGKVPEDLSRLGNEPGKSQSEGSQE